MTAANANTAPAASAARFAASSEAEAVLRLMAMLPVLPSPTARGEDILRLFR